MASGERPRRAIRIHCWWPILGTGNVGWYGTVAEHGQLSYYAMRLKVQQQHVAEVEVILDRKGDAGPWGDPAHFTA